MKLTSFGLSDLGNKRRNNEDRFIRDDRHGLYLVADGMGGAAAGELASGHAASLAYSELLAQTTLFKSFAAGDEDSALRVISAVELAVKHANEHVFREGQANPELKGMGTTLSVLCVGGRRAVVGHVGDSRVYHLTGGKAAVLTQDHTWVMDQVRKGKMTDEEARVSKKSNLIMRALGLSLAVEVDTLNFPVAEGDRFMLCSDGLHGYLLDLAEATTILKKRVPLQRLGWEFIALARDRGGKDNVTVVLVEGTRSVTGETAKARA